MFQQEKSKYFKKILRKQFKIGRSKIYTSPKNSAAPLLLTDVFSDTAKEAMQGQHLASVDLH
jgi:hypothetical protein